MPVSVWGDGFANDGLSEILNVTEWSSCSGDELARFFPRLTSVAGTAHPPVLQLELLIADRTAAGRLQPRSSLVARFNRSVFGSTAAHRRQVHSGLASHEEQDLAFLRTMLDIVKAHASRSNDCLVPCARGMRNADIISVNSASLPAVVDEATLTRFAYHSAIHPAYFWPTAALLHEKLTTACWLGIVSRGRPAFMLPEVADYLIDTLRRWSNGGLTLLDAHLAILVGEYCDFERLLKVAHSRRLGDSMIMYPKKSSSNRRGGRDQKRTVDRVPLKDTTFESDPDNLSKCMHY